MTIDLKYTIPFVLPFLILATLRALVFCARAEWNAEGAFAISLVFGPSIGGVAALVMHDNGITWPLRIGGRKP